MKWTLVVDEESNNVEVHDELSRTWLWIWAPSQVSLPSIALLYKITGWQHHWWETEDQQILSTLFRSVLDSPNLTLHGRLMVLVMWWRFYDPAISASSFCCLQWILRGIHRQHLMPISCTQWKRPTHPRKFKIAAICMKYSKKNHVLTFFKPPLIQRWSSGGLSGLCFHAVGMWSLQPISGQLPFS